MRTTVLPFKETVTEEMLTANAGLALLCEFKQGFGLHRWLEQEMPLPGNRRGYAVLGYVKSRYAAMIPTFAPPPKLTSQWKYPLIQAHLSLDKAPPAFNR